MASALVDGVVGKLGGMMVDEITKEVSLVLNFRDDFEWLSKELTNLKGYLRDADAQSAQNASVKRWLLDVEKIARDAEDIVDECALQSRGTSNKCSQLSCVSAFNCCQLVFRYRMARRIKDLKDRMRSIMEEVAELKLVADVTHPDQPSTSRVQNINWRGLNRIESGSHPVGINSKVEEVLSLLNDPAAPVIAVVGMGGVGKTFLMQNVFNRIKGKFDKSIWLSISQTYSLKKLQAALGLELDLKAVVNERVDEVKAAELIHGRLQSTKFLIVLDDVWRVTEQENLIYALGLPRRSNAQSKIVVTTRSRRVSSNMNARVYELQPLSKEESWNLFSAVAFPDNQQNQPPVHLEGVAHQIEGECGGLPLAAKIVAASLAGKRLSWEWESKLEQLRGALTTEDPIMEILKLSYDSLPAHLKPCFVYLSFFPEDEEIDYQYLINLWVAEGFVPQGEDQLDVGWSYICHLQSLCLIDRVGEVGDLYDQDDRRFKLHDLLLDLAICIEKESQCAFSVDIFKKSPTVQTDMRYHRLLMGKRSIHDGDVDTMARNRAYSASCLHTLTFSQNGGIQNIPSILLNDAKVLRVLDLSGTEISSLPDCVGNLKFLRVLNLSGTKITKVRECVRGIKSLCFLDISRCKFLEQFPEWIGELDSLEHLDIRTGYGGKCQGWMPKGISKLVRLQVLKLDSEHKLSVEENELLKLDHFVNLVNLRELRIIVSHEAELKSIEDGILATLVKMRHLMINNVTNKMRNLSERMLAMKDLEYLNLQHFAVPNWICGFSNLMHLVIWLNRQAEYPALETMPNLVVLHLGVNGICKALPKGFGKSGGFPQLRHFTITQFFLLEELPELENGAMPCLEKLKVDDCQNLKKVPRGLELLKSLKECDFSGTRVTHMFEKGGELWNKMKVNNPNVKLIMY